MATKKKTAKKTGNQVKVLDQSDPEFLPVQYNMTEAAIAKLREEYDPVLIPDTEVKGDEGYLIVHDKAMAIVKVRTAIEKKRKELKSDALAWGKSVDSKAKELTEIIEEIEDPWKRLKAELDEKEAREAEEARIKEVERIQEIEVKVSVIQLATSNLVGADVAELKKVLKLLSDTVIDGSYCEFEEAAQFHKDAGINKLNAVVAEREVFEEQQAQLKASQDALAAAQKEIDDKAETAQKELDEQAAKINKDRLANEAEAKRLKDEAEAQASAEKQRKEDEAFAELEEKQRKQKEKDDADVKVMRDAELYKRLPEDVKMRTYLAGLRSVELPEVKNEDMQAILARALIKLDDISDIIFNGTQDIGESDVST